MTTPESGRSNNMPGLGPDTKITTGFGIHGMQTPLPRYEGEALPGKVLQSGTHLARILAVRQPDNTFEAQVFVRLTREPEVAETYIHVGLYGSEEEAWAAAEERAQRAFDEHEF